MDRTTFTILAKKLIELKLSSNLNKDTIKNVFEYKSSNVSNQLYASYKETELIDFLFKNIPYYEVPTFLKNFLFELENILINTKFYHKFSLIYGCLHDMNYKIQSYIEQIAYNNLRILINQYISKKTNRIDMLSTLKKTSIQIESISTKLGYSYEEMVIPIFDEKNEITFKEQKEKSTINKLSKKSMEKRRELYYSLITDFIIKFTPDTLLDFENQLNILLESNPVLKEIFLPILNDAIKQCLIKWNTTTSIDLPLLKTLLHTN